MSLRALPACLALLLLGAHLLRLGDFGPVLLCLALLPLAFVRRPWARLALQAVLALAALEWFRTLLVLRAGRMALGLPWMRMALILGAVAAFTLAAAACLPRPSRPSSAG